MPGGGIRVEQLDPEAATNGQGVKYNSATGLFEITDVGATMAALMIRRTSAITLTGAYVDVTFDTTDLETLPSVLEHNNTNIDDVDIKATSTYLIQYNARVDLGASGATCQIRVRLNDTSVLAGTQFDEGESSHNQAHELMGVRTCIVSLTAGDKITVQAQHAVPTSAIQSEVTLCVIRLEGAIGPTGATGLQGDPGVGNWQGAWLTATSYSINDFVENNGSLYICTSAHTSGASDEPGVGGSWTTKWDLSVAKGDTGAQGPTGSGSTIVVQEHGINLTNTPHATLNFLGGLTATDDGAGAADVVVDLSELTVDAAPDRAVDTMLFNDVSALPTIVNRKILIKDIVGALGDFPCVVARRTTTLASTAAYVPLAMQATDVETNAAIIEHDNTNTERVNVKETGLYLCGYGISYSGGANSTHFHARLFKNNTTEVAGSIQHFLPVGASNEAAASLVIPLLLTANDYLELEALDLNAGITFEADAYLWILRLKVRL